MALMLALPQLVLATEESCAEGAPLEQSCSSCAVRCSSVVRSNTSELVRGAVDCLSLCGFAVIPSIVDATGLSDLRDALDAWSLSADAAPFAHSCLRGNRSEFVLPHATPFDAGHVFAPQTLLEIVDEYTSRVLPAGQPRWSMASMLSMTPPAPPTAAPLPALEMVTLLNNPAGSLGQGVHKDASLWPARLGLKVQIPLVDVDPTMGPISLYPLSHTRHTHSSSSSSISIFLSRLFPWLFPWDTPKAAADSAAASLACGALHGNVSRGTAIIYSHSLAHHGTPNNSSRDRPALDYSFLPSIALGKNLHINRVCFSEQAWHAAEQRGAAVEPIFRELRRQREERGNGPTSL